MNIGPVNVVERVLVIAEIGVNHDGSVERAVQLVDAAKRAGADAIKLQLFTAYALVSPGTGTADYQQINCGATDQVALLKQYELSFEDAARVRDHASELGLMTIATPFSLSDVDTIAKLNLPAIKIASPDLVNTPLLERCAALGRPMLISTGAATMEEIESQSAWLRERAVSHAMLHCVSCYPTPDDAANLAWISSLARRTQAIVGYSDHTTNPLAGALAVAAGARVIEKHLTWDCSAAGPDHAASFDPPHFANYVKSIRDAERLLGRGERRVLEIEQDVRRLSRQSVSAARAIACGRAIDADDLTIRRPGTGIPAADLKSVIGTTARVDIAAGATLTREMVG
jgi:N,N'-diacetyllegionaminate synthase